jgi:hypothetical protein
VQKSYLCAKTQDRKKTIKTAYLAMLEEEQTIANSLSVTKTKMLGGCFFSSFHSKRERNQI